VSKNSGRSTTGDAKVPAHYPMDPVTEAAKHLRLSLTRYIAGREPFATVREAFEILDRAVHSK